MSLKDKIEKTMYAEGMDDRIQDIAKLIDAPAEDVKSRMKTLGFTDYIKLMSALKTYDAGTIKDMMGLQEDSAYYGTDLSAVRQMKYKNTVKVTDIQWDADDMDHIKQALDAGDLRRDMIVPIPADLDDEEVDEYISDFITDKTGWTHKGFNIEEGAMHISPDIARAKTLQHTLPSLDREKYEPRDGLEGPIMTKSGKVVYYDPIEGSYYDPDTDIYLSYEEWKELSEAYSTGSQGGEEEAEQEPDAQEQQAANNKLKTQRTQAMQRLGRDNLGGATAQMAANAIDKAEQGMVLTPIQRQALAHQAANLDNLAMNPDTRIQFRNLLNKLKKQEQ